MKTKFLFVFFFSILFTTFEPLFSQVIPNGDFEIVEGEKEKACVREWRDSISKNYVMNWYTSSKRAVHFIYNGKNVNSKNGFGFIGVEDSCVLFISLRKIAYSTNATFSFSASSDKNFQSNFDLNVWLSDTLFSNINKIAKKPDIVFHISGRDINNTWQLFRNPVFFKPKYRYLYLSFSNQAQINSVKSMVYFDNFHISILDNSDAKIHQISKGIKFKRGKLILEKSSTLHIDSLIALLNTDKDRKFSISVYTDNKGHKDSLKILSEQQSLALKRILLSKGISEERILKTEGFGSSNPISSNQTEKGRKINSRVVLSFEKKED